MLYKEHIDKFTSDLINELSNIEVIDDEKLDAISSKYSVEKCFLKFNLL